MGKLALFACTVSLLIGCTLENDKNNKTSYHSFESYADFQQTLYNIILIEDSIERENTLLAFWDSLKLNRQIPFAINDSVAFLYKGQADSVSWAGDFSGWKPINGKQLVDNNLWMLEQVFPSDARLDYKVVVGPDWILDPANSNIQYSGWGANSELRMQNWVYPQETVLKEGVRRGNVSDDQIMAASTQTLNYKVQYKVYTPVDYENLSNLPVIYVTDGHEYADDNEGAMLIILDNMISAQVIPPVIAVFIDPRDPDDLNKNKRMEQYTGNRKFADFVADELVPVIDANYKTNNSPDARAIMGTSLGGLNSAYFGVTRSDKFHLIGIHSPSPNKQIIQAYENSEKLPLKIFMGTGVIHDTENQARALKAVFEEKGYPLQYMEVNQGHSWGNWRAMLNEPLIYFFG